MSGSGKRIVWALVSDQICLICHLLARELLESYAYHKRGWYLIGGRIIETASMKVPEIILSSRLPFLFSLTLPIGDTFFLFTLLDPPGLSHKGASW